MGVAQSLEEEVQFHFVLPWLEFVGGVGSEAELVFPEVVCFELPPVLQLYSSEPESVEGFLALCL